MQEQPTFHRGPNGEVLEYRPVPVSREQFEADLNAEKEKAGQISGNVKHLEGEVERLEDELEKVDKLLQAARKEEEDAEERVNFRAAKLAAFDAVPPAVEVAEPEPAEELAEHNGDAAAADSEDGMDDGDDGEADADEPDEATGVDEEAAELDAPASEAQEVMVRRRSRI